MPTAIGIIFLLVAIAWLFYALSRCRSALEQQPRLSSPPIPVNETPATEPPEPIEPRVNPRTIGFDEHCFLPNRNYFEHQVKAEWSRCARVNQPISLLFANIDRHGDDDRPDPEQVKTIAYGLDTEARRGADLVFRYSDDAFAIVLVDTGHADALAVAHRMQAHISALGLSVPPDAVRESRSVSVAVTTADTGNRDLNLQHWLDEALDALSLLPDGQPGRMIARSI